MTSQWQKPFCALLFQCCLSEGLPKIFNFRFPTHLLTLAIDSGTVPFTVTTMTAMRADGYNYTTMATPKIMIGIASNNDDT